jgi:hypothetical protein
MGISLIANSGIQFHSFEAEFNSSHDVIKSMGLHECTNSNYEMTVEYAYFLPNDGVWVAKKSLIREGYINEKNQLSEDVNVNTLTALDQGNECYTANDIEDALEYYENKWIPLPFFKKGETGNFTFGPTTWVRGLFKDITLAENKRTKKYKIILAFDTNIAKDPEGYFTPKYSDISSGNNYYALCSNEDQNLNFCNRDFGGDWVDDYLIQEYYVDGKIPSTFPMTRHLGAYLYLIKYLATLDVFPEVEFHSDNNEAIDVDLVLDIGNANTCGLLFESPATNKHFEFDKVKKLELNDLSLDNKDFSKSQRTSYDNPFNMRLVFSKADLGGIRNYSYQNSFAWPSLVRVGQEAKRLINLGELNRQEETATNNSSPKRYLWDDKQVKIPWEYIKIPKLPHKDKEDETAQNIERFRPKVYYEGISNQFKGDGRYTTDNNFGVIPQYSRKSLMTFVFIEIYLHALTQINSHKFRTDHGGLSKPRKLRRVIITCPTSIVQAEQVILRECAMNAGKALTHFYKTHYELSDPTNFLNFEVIPSPKDLAKKLDVSDTKKHWIYDEATCCQLVYLYSEISKRYLNDSQLFFDLYGKKRNNIFDGKEEFLGDKSLIIGSIDIGGGTTDLMICSYHYTKNQTDAVIEPRPLFWDSFNFAGDDLLKKIVQFIVLEVPNGDSFEEGCTGVIETHARNSECGDVTSKMLNFFGTDKTSQPYQQRIYRKNFVVQFAIPVALKFLEHARLEKEDVEVGFEEIFPDSKPNEELLAYFNKLMNGAGSNKFRVQDIVWKLSKDRVNDIVESTFSSLLKQLSILVSAYDCDIVLLAGKPTTLSKFRELMIGYYPVSPDRIISLNSYRVGRWYPYSDERGCFEDTKTIVPVGALVSLMGEENKLKNFKLNTEYLRTKLISTCDYIGALNAYTKDIDEEYLTIEIKRKEAVVDSLPLVIGYKQISNKKYLGRPIYSLEFNTEKLKENVITKFPESSNGEIGNELKKYRSSLERRMPYKITFKRSVNLSKEEIQIDKIKDADNNEIPPKFLTLSLKTLSEDSYWLDKGIFMLKKK